VAQKADQRKLSIQPQTASKGDLLVSKDPVQEVVSLLRKIIGIRKIKIFSSQERRSLLQTELIAEESMIGGWGFNEGLREALSRKFVIACSTDMSFKWPSGPYVVLKEGDTVIGFITDNVDQIKQQYNEKIRVLGKNFVLFPERIRRLKVGKRSPTLFIDKGFNLPELERDAKVKNAVLAFCTRAGNAHLKELLKEEEKPEIGSIVVGFDIS
jgi:hypothetical protein